MFGRLAGGDRERQRQNGGRAGVAQQHGGNRHGPAAVDLVVHEQHRPACRGKRFAKSVRHDQRAPQRGQALGTVVAARARAVRRGVAERPEVGQPADLGDPLAEAPDERGRALEGIVTTEVGREGQSQAASTLTSASVS